jgi:hypothetical protein
MLGNVLAGSSGKRYSSFEIVTGPGCRFEMMPERTTDLQLDALSICCCCKVVGSKMTPPNCFPVHLR